MANSLYMYLTRPINTGLPFPFGGVDGGPTSLLLIAISLLACTLYVFLLAFFSLVLALKVLEVWRAGRETFGRLTETRTSDGKVGRFEGSVSTANIASETTPDPATETSSTTVHEAQQITIGLTAVASCAELT
jgi:hypothetical protein